MSSDKLFARKFDIVKYPEIVMRIYNSVKNADTEPPWTNAVIESNPSRKLQ